ncbi:MAG: heavy metal-binding domain-containing protein [Pseudomonadota bacterium]
MFDFYLFLALIAIGFIVGQTLERRHYRSIEQREADLLLVPTTNSKKPLGALEGSIRSELVQGACVISVDYFKRIVAALRQLFGGNVRSYETLVDRARREAILRLKESCPDALQIINLRIETSSITKGSAQQVGAVEVHAYATAIYAD